MNTNNYIKFWGIYDEIPSSKRYMSMFGNNTLCTEIHIDGTNFIFDGGTGFYQYGNQYKKTNKKESVNLFLSSVKWSNIQGIPHCNLILEKKNKVNIYCPNIFTKDPKELLSILFTEPFFDKKANSIKGTVQYDTINTGKKFFCDDIELSTFNLGTSVAYRIKFKDIDVAYIRGFNPEKININDLVNFLKNTNHLIMEGYFTENELEQKSDENHCDINSAVKIMEMTNSKHLYITSLSPDKKDTEIISIEEKLYNINENIVFAKEEMIVEL